MRVFRALLVVSFLLGFPLAKASSTGEVVRRSMFQTVDNRHQIGGGVDVERRADGLYLVLESDFAVTHGPDLRFVLRDSSNVTPMVIVAPLASFAGTQEYRLPFGDEQLGAFDEVVVYCAKYHVDFGVARIGRGNF